MCIIFVCTCGVLVFWVSSEWVTFVCMSLQPTRGGTNCWGTVAPRTRGCPLEKDRLWNTQIVSHWNRVSFCFVLWCMFSGACCWWLYFSVSCEGSLLYSHSIIFVCSLIFWVTKAWWVSHHFLHTYKLVFSRNFFNLQMQNVDEWSLRVLFK